MNRVSTFARRHRRARTLLPLAAMLALAAWIACSNDSAPYEPLGNDHGTSLSVVAGAVRDGSRTTVGGAVVTMETISQGMPATARLLREQPALAGKLDTRANAASDDPAGRRVTLTDARGRFAFGDVPAGDYVIQVRADDHLGASLGLTVEPPTALLDTVIADINLTPTGTFSGVATLENAAVHSDIVVYAEGTSYVAVTAPDGSYAITDVPVGGYTIQATHAHYLNDGTSGTITYAGENVGLSSMLLKLDNNIPPVATVTVPAQTMDTVTPIQFLGTGTDLDGTVVLYEWDFEDDGVMDTLSTITGNTQHVFPVAGTYTVKLRVTDNLGAIGLDAKTITISPALPFVYMSITGNDANPGTQASPVKTLAQAYVVAQNQGKTVIWATMGNFAEVPAFLPGIDIVGGHDPSTWAANAGYTLFNVGNQRATANNISVPTAISRVEILTSNQLASTNSIALYSLNSTSALQFTDCIFRASNAGPVMSTGASGSSGLNGSLGGPGTLGACDLLISAPGGAGGASPAGCLGGTGGTGGQSSANGSPGASGLCGGGAGGSGGPWGDPGSAGLNGSPGTPGSTGSSGVVGTYGNIVANEWVTAAGGNGSAGSDGKGGGGGGGGGGQDCVFCSNGTGNGGGGGGGGATGGGGGFGGSSGYGSFAVFLMASTPTFSSCQLFTGNGGNGSTGGIGGFGGVGGPGGIGQTACPSEVGRGGNGGAGGNGGGGGGGGGGNGGLSVGVFYSNGFAPTLSGMSYTLGTPGFGGGGGAAAGGGGPVAPNGANGIAQNAFSHNP